MENVHLLIQFDAHVKITIFNIGAASGKADVL